MLSESGDLSFEALYRVYPGPVYGLDGPRNQVLADILRSTSAMNDLAFFPKINHYNSAWLPLWSRRFNGLPLAQNTIANAERWELDGTFASVDFRTSNPEAIRKAVEHVKALCDSEEFDPHRVTPEEIQTATSLYGVPDEKAKQDAAIRRGCLFGLWRALMGVWHVSVILDDIDPRVFFFGASYGRSVLGQGRPQLPKFPFTGSELRFLYEHWDDYKREQRIIFYRGGKALVKNGLFAAPWEMEDDDGRKWRSSTRTYEGSTDYERLSASRERLNRVKRGIGLGGTTINCYLSGARRQRVLPNPVRMQCRFVARATPTSRLVSAHFSVNFL